MKLFDVLTKIVELINKHSNLVASFTIMGCGIRVEDANGCVHILDGETVDCENDEDFNEV